LVAGASIAINGTCLTVAGMHEDKRELLVEFDVMQVVIQSMDVCWMPFLSLKERTITQVSFHTFQIRANSFQSMECFVCCCAGDINQN
jgi:hypothetical protein